MQFNSPPRKIKNMATLHLIKSMARSPLRLGFFLAALLILSGCETPPTASNPPAIVPNPQPGAPIAGGLQIAFARATPLLPDMMSWKPGTVNVHFNGAATTTGYVDVAAQSGGWTLYRSVGSAKFVPGQTDVQVPIKVDVKEPAQIPLKVSIRGSSAEFQTMTYYGDKTREPFVRGSDSSLGLSGRWFHDGKPTSISVSAGGSVTMTNEQGQSSSGKMTSNNELDISGIRGRVSDGGRRISWSNGTEWTR